MIQYIHIRKITLRVIKFTPLNPFYEAFDTRTRHLCVLLTKRTTGI